MDDNKSSDYAKGRADAAKGKYDAPNNWTVEYFGSNAEAERIRTKVSEYNEGHADKQREMKK